MKYLLDTSVISELISKDPNPSVVNFVDSLDHEDIYLSAITVGEIAKGIQGLKDSARKQDLKKWLHEDLLVRFDGKIIPLDSIILIRWGELSAQLEGAGILHPAINSLIAATVLAHHLVLVTFDDSGFESTGIEVVNPW